MKYLFLILILDFFLIFVAHAEGKSSTTEESKEFSATKFIQLDSLDIPKELQVIQDQIVQNAIDVIILGSSHTVIYSQKIEEGYTEKYKHFYGLKISILPLLQKNDYFLLKIQYYNWTTTKFDKTLKTEISKYNVLNELRFALYELFKGKKFVQDNKESLEQESFERIISIRDSFEKENTKQIKKTTLELASSATATQKSTETHRIKREMKNNDSLTPSKSKNESALSQKQSMSETPNSLNNNNNQNDQKINKNTSSNSSTPSKSKKEQKKNNTSNSSFNEGPTSESTTSQTHLGKSLFRIQTGLSSSQISSSKLISTKTNPQYLLIGTDYYYRLAMAFPLATHLYAQGGYPLKKENYQFSISKKLGGNIQLDKIFSFLDLITGAFYQSFDFVNLVHSGEGLQTISNNVLSYRFGFGLNIPIRDTLTRLELFSQQSIMVANKYKSELSFSSQIASLAFSQKKHTANFYFEKGKIRGDYSGEFSTLALIYSYSINYL